MSDSDSSESESDLGTSVTLHGDPSLKPLEPVPAKECHKDLAVPQAEEEVLDNEDLAQNDAAGLIWPLLLVVAVLLSLVGQQFWSRNPASHDSIGHSPDDLEDQPARCAAEVKLTPAPYSWQSNDPPRFHALGSMKIPVSADLMSFVNMPKDDGCAGAFRVSQTGEPGSEATVDVDVSYAQPGAFHDVHVCRLRRTKRDVGEVVRFGIDTPETDGLDSLSNETRHRALHVDIHLRLPRAHAASSLPLNIKELHTDLHQYDHLLSTPPTVHFKKIDFSTVLARIESESVSGDVVSLCSTYNSITGSYNISRALTIQSEDGLVDVTAHLHNDDPSAGPTSLNISTIENPIFSRVSLHSRSPTAPQGNFSISTSTGHGAINLTLLSAPPASVLTASAEVFAPDGDWLEGYDDWEWDPEWDFDPVMPARVTVKVHEAFEGAIDLEMTEPTGFRPAVVSHVGVYPGAEAEAEEAEEAEGGAEGPDSEGARELGAELEVPGDGTCDAWAGVRLVGLMNLLLRAGEVRRGCIQCLCVRRVDVDAGRPNVRDGRAVGGISWGAERLPDEELGRRGKITVRTVDSPIILIV